MIMPHLMQEAAFWESLQAPDTLNACNELNDRGHSDNDGTGIEQPDALRTAGQRRQSADAENGKYTCDHTNHAADDHEDGCYLQNLLTFHL